MRNPLFISFGFTILLSVVTTILGMVLPLPLWLLPAVFGVVFVCWGIWQGPINRLIQRFPIGVQRRVFSFENWIKKFLYTKEQILSATNFNEKNKTYIRVALPGFIVEGSNVSSIIDNGTGDYTINFLTPLNAETLAVHPVGETSRDFNVVGVNEDFVRVLFDKEPGEFSLRIDD